MMMADQTRSWERPDLTDLGTLEELTQTLTAGKNDPAHGNPKS